MVEYCVCCGTNDVVGFYQAYDGPSYVEIFPLCDKCLTFAEDVTFDLVYIIENEKVGE